MYGIRDRQAAGVRTVLALTMTACAFALSAQGAAAQTYKFKTINIPGASQTALFQDAGGTIVGWNYDASGNPTCTLIQGKTYTAISDPNGVQTNCYGISSAGTVVGYYNTSDDAAIGFTYSNGSFSDFSLPGISGALPIASSTNGILAGYYYDNNNAPWGFTLKGTKVTTFQISGAAYIFPTGVNSHGELTLEEIDSSGNEHCMVGNAPNFTELKAPGASTTYCFGLNNNGKIVGSYVDSTGAFDGYAYDPATAEFYTINYPGAADTYLRGVTNSETLVGYYRTASSGPRIGLKATGSFP
jgi:probable HAF family extracellular repeat protein/YD repeat-containing protein